MSSNRRVETGNQGLIYPQHLRPICLPLNPLECGTGRNSPFTSQLLRELVIAGRDIEVALKAVRAGVQQNTKGEQIPWVASSMTGDFYVAR